MDYKDSLNLPKTDFPMRANLSKKEPEMLKMWEEINIYQKIRDVSKGREVYILHDGPPYANGSIHLGTALNKDYQGYGDQGQEYDGLRQHLCSRLGLSRPAHRASGRQGAG